MTDRQIEFLDKFCVPDYSLIDYSINKKAKAREHHSIAKEMINAMGYHRRDNDVKEIEEKLSNPP